MDKQQFQGHWNQIKGKIKESFGKLTDDDLLQVKGQRDEIIGKLQTLYGVTAEEAENKLRAIEKDYYTQEFGNHWNELQERLKQKWTALTDEDLASIKGNSDQLIAKLQERYQYTQEKAETEFFIFIETLAPKEKVPNNDLNVIG